MNSGIVWGPAIQHKICVFCATGSEGGPEPHVADGPVHSSGHPGNGAFLTPKNSWYKIRMKVFKHRNNISKTV